MKSNKIIVNRIIFTQRNSKQGYALVTTLITLLVLSILGATVMSLSVADTSFSKYQQDKMKAYYIAKSGANAAASWVSDANHNKAEIQTILSNNQTNADVWTSFGGGDGQFKISFPDVDIVSPKIQSIGKYNNRTQTVSVTLTKNYFFDSAVTYTGSLDLKNPGSDINGGVTRTTTSSPPTGYTGNIETMPVPVIDRTFDPVLVPTLDSYAGVNWNVASGTTVFSSTSDPYANKSFGIIELGSSELLTFNLSEDMAIVCNEFNVLNGTINVTGNGILNIYANSFDFKGVLANLTPSTCKVVVNIIGTGNLDFQTSGVFEAFIYGPNADILIKAGMDSVGAIVGKNVSVENTSIVTYNPLLGNIYPEDMGFESMGYSFNQWGE